MGLTDHLAEKIRDRRLAIPLTQKEAAVILGVSERTLQNWEAGDAFPRPKHRRTIDAFLTDEVAA